MEKSVLFKTLLAASLVLPTMLVSCKKDDDNKASAKAKTIPVEGVSLSTHDTTLFKGEYFILNANILPDSASKKDVEWSSGDDNIATVTSAGKVIATEQGSTFIYVTTVDGEFKDSCKLSVINNIEIKDQNLLKLLVSNPDINKDGDDGISRAEALSVTSLKIADEGIASFDELGYFANLENLVCNSNQITSLDLTNLSKLKTLLCDNNQISKLDISNNKELTTLTCDFNNLDTLDIRNNDKLASIFCGDQKNGTLKLQLTIDQFNTVWKNNNSENKGVELVMNIFEGATFHSDKFQADLKDGDSTTYSLARLSFEFRLYGADGTELSFYDPSVFEQIVWTSSNESVATVSAQYKNEGESNTAKMTVEAVSTGNTIITGTVNDEYSISFNLEVK